MNHNSILIVDDEEGIRHGVKTFFIRQGFSVFDADNSCHAVNIVQENSLDAAIVDIRLKQGESGLELVKKLRQIEPDLVIIVITGYGSIDTAVEALKGGAVDYIQKPIDNLKLFDAVKRNLELCSLRNENLNLKEELRHRNTPFHFHTCSPVIQNLLSTADKVKHSSASVLITGESGTGKEVMARYIHYTSRRKDEPFIGINCAALSESLLLSELFGHEKGAFTGALERKTGKFETADKGTLFLDEIGDMSLDVQAKLLRVLEQNSFERVGGTRAIKVNVRVVAATNKELSVLIGQKKFREDLYYRINGFSIHLPPLRQRREDIPLLADYFLRFYNREYGRHIKRISPEVIFCLKAYSWPGNARELKNIISQSVLLCEGEEIVQNQLCRIPYGEGQVSGIVPDIDSLMRTFGSDGKASLGTVLQQLEEQLEEEILRRSLKQYQNQKSRCAEALGISGKTLTRKLRKYGIRPSV